MRNYAVLSRCVTVFLLAVVATGCATSGRGPITPDDAQIAVRVKTALVNEATLGVRPIDVDVQGHVVTLGGTVASVTEAERAIEVARAVPGVARVESTLIVDEAGPPPRVRPSSTLPALAPRPDGRPARLVAVGASLTQGHPRSNLLTRTSTFGPLFRFRPSAGLNPTVGFSWLDTQLRGRESGAPLAALRVRPVMGGLEYRVGEGRVTAAVSIVAGYAFNSLSPDTTQAGAGRAIAVSNSFAWRPGGSVWFDVSPRISLNLFGGYLLTRPELTFASDLSVVTRRVTAHTVIVSAGVAYWIM